VAGPLNLCGELPKNRHASGPEPDPGFRVYGVDMMKRKRIGYLLQHFPRKTDTFIKREIRSLQKFGTDVQVISVWKPFGSDTTSHILAQWANDTYFILPKSPLAIAWSVLRVVMTAPKRFIAASHLAMSTRRPGVHGFIYQLIYFLEAILVAERLRKNEIRHIHNHIGDHSGIVTMIAACLAGIGYSITFHGWPVFFDAKYSRIKEKVRGARFTRSISYFCRSQLMMFSESDDPTPFKIVHCGLSLANYSYRPPKREVNTLFCAARLSPEKGHSVTLHALRLLLDKGHELNLRLAGDGPSKKQLHELSDKLKIADRVSFLGYLTEEDVIGELEACDLFVLSSFVEGIPVSAMEAMAIGVPVIATNIAGTSELIEDGKTGLLVRPSDSHALADAIARMIADYKFRLLVAEHARKKVSDEFDIEREAIKLNEYLLQSCD
jgi:colanic acid/amylovoran biosynthesis glycosyltransferase